MLKNNLLVLHNAKLIFDSIEEVKSYDNFASIKTGECIIILGNKALGDGLLQVRRIDAQNDMTQTGIPMKDKRFANLMYDVKISNEGDNVEKYVTLSDFFIPNKDTNKIPLTGITAEDISNAKEIVLYSKCESGKSIGICPMTPICVPAELKTGVTAFLVSSSDGQNVSYMPVVFKIEGNSLSYKLPLTIHGSHIKDSIGSLQVVKNITVVIK